ncbi:MAG: nitric oxide reductase subunit [Thermodesulfobacteriota bacterium]|nr:nitric oxide reductase subunit [Thermodesulfobacteriota bacterium]
MMMRSQTLCKRKDRTMKDVLTAPKTRAVFLFLLVLSFGVLLFGGYLINRDKPPIPSAVRSTQGEMIFSRDDVVNGQNYYFSRGGQHIGTIWGHGSYLAPDWSADFLHRMGLYLAARHQGLSPDRAANFSQKDFDSLDEIVQATLKAHVKRELKQNLYDPGKDQLTFTPNQQEAFEVLRKYYTGLFKNGNEDMGLQPGIVRTDAEGHLLTSFFAWLSWAAVTNRLDDDVTYTSNWPYDPLVGNEPIPSALIWSIVSVIVLILAISVVLFVYRRYIGDDDYAAQEKPFLEPHPTGSQKAVVPYFITAMALFLLQIGMGSITGHFTVEGSGFFGIPLGEYFPYAATRTWHLQLAIFWIATCFLATGLFVGPFVGREPKGQWMWVTILFAAVVLVVVGTLGGTWASVQGFFDGEAFLFGHQGYEFIELGRVWQILLSVGMIIWLVLVFRSIAPALRKEDDKGGLTHMLLYSSVAIPLFYMAALFYGKGSHLSDAEYWRWWVVHLWVEGFFEVFAAVVLAFILSRIGVVSERYALITVYASVFLYLAGGIVGTFHHLYWSGTPIPIMALGGVFSALEVVPLALLGFEAAQNLRAVEKSGENYAYKWPIYFFLAVAFWNVVGAGVFGFLINPPIVLYYVQGMNTTPIHAHTALFGVYGFLAIALMLFSLRHIISKQAWSDRMLKWSFWGLNIGLVTMTVFSLIPAGFYQIYFAVKYGVWYARSPEIASGTIMKTFAWFRVVPDVIFFSGAIILFAFVVRGAYLSFAKK